MKMIHLFLCLLITTEVLSQNEHTIGGIFYEDDLSSIAVFKMSAQFKNFTPAVKIASRRGKILQLSEHVCSLATEGVIGIIDGTGGLASEHIQAVCDTLEIPHVALQDNTDYDTGDWFVLNMFPSTQVFNKVVKQIVEKKEWNNFTILYVKGHSIAKVNELLKMGNATDRNTATIRELSGDDYRDVLINAKEHSYTNFIVDCPSENIEQFLKHAQQVGLMADEHSYVFLSPDLFTLDLDRYRYGGVNITGFRLIDLKLKVKKDEELSPWDFAELFQNETGDLLQPEQIKTKTLLIHDAIVIFSKALQKVKVERTPVDCFSYEPWGYGSSLLNFMRTNMVNGLTGVLGFNGNGERSDVEMEILELTPAGNQSIGKWRENTVHFERPKLPSANIIEESKMRNKTFRILIALAPPYGYMKESTTKLTGNDQYEGFTIDLINELAEMLGFNYEFIVENTYGAKKDGEWNGMIRQILDDKAEFGICDFTVTAERQSAIDFSTPFMTLGIGILFKKPSKQPPPMFSFMAVFSTQVWMYIVLVQLVLGVIMIFVGRISHKEWQNPVPCIEQPEEFSNQFSFANSVWLIIGSVMQQGSEIAPIAIAPRMITSVWWFFTMVMVASYTGTLVAFLTIEKNVLPFADAEQLYEKKSIAYGAKAVGATISFFNESTKPPYKLMYERMKKENWLVDNNDKAVERANREQYAVFMESTSIEYYKERYCDLIQVGDLLDSKSYAIGMRKGSSYKKEIDDALLKLKEKAVIQKLKDKWWKEMRGGGKCENNEKDEEASQLEMKNMIGSFVVLGAGCLIGLFISITDMLWGVFKRTVKYNTTFRYELVEELKFALTFQGDVKPVKRPRPSAGSTEKLAELDLEGKDEIRSLRSIRSSDTHRTHHSHSSKHSSRSQSVAFARQREFL